MALKRRAIPLPELAGRSVLDVGCDMGYWSFLAAQLGAAGVVGIDRNRMVKGRGHVDLVAACRSRARELGLGSCRFESLELGRQWDEVGAFDVVLALSVYHHVYECAGGAHEPVWFWLWRQMQPRGELLWEGPVDSGDPVVAADVSPSHQAGYTRDRILGAARRYFEAELLGPALHEPTREVWRFKSLPIRATIHRGRARAGAGGAAKAFEHAGGRRIAEIERALGMLPQPGSLNIELDDAFDWDRGYYRAEILDVVDRQAGLGSEWAPRWARFYPLIVGGDDAHAFRFEGESYPETFVELIAPLRLRDRLPADGRVTLCR